MKTYFWLAVLLFPTLSPAVTSTYEIDREHSSVTFKIRHVIGKVSGRFDSFSGTILFDPKKLADLKVDASIDTASINTNVAPRDKHLRSGDFFDVDNPKHPEYKTIKFSGTKVTGARGNKAKLHGDLTIHGVTKPVTLDLEFTGEQEFFGARQAGFTATMTLNRKDYGLTWNQAVETGGVLVGEEVEVTLEITGQVKKK